MHEALAHGYEPLVHCPRRSRIARAVHPAPEALAQGPNRYRASRAARARPDASRLLPQD